MTCFCTRPVSTVEGFPSSSRGQGLKCVCLTESQSLSIWMNFGVVFSWPKKDALADLTKEAGVIVATGGGSACFYNNIEEMNSHGLTVYLKVSTGELVRRLESTKIDRPLLWGKSNDELTVYITEMLRIREPFYSKARVIVPADNPSAEDIVEAIRPYLK